MKKRLKLKFLNEIFEEMVIYAHSLGLWQPKDSLEGIEKDIKFKNGERK